MWRPRPKNLTLLTVSFCHYLIAAWSVHALVAAVEMAVMRQSMYQATPWETIRERAGRIAVDERLLPPVWRMDARFAELGLYTVGAALLLALFVMLFWPVRRTFSAAHFILAMSSAIAAFGAIRLGLPILQPMPATSIPILLAPMICFVAERRAQSLLANLFETHPLKLWLLRIPLPMMAIGLAAWLQGVYVAIWSAMAIFAASLLAAFFRPAARFEQLREPEMSRSVAPLVMTAIVIVAGCAIVFGWKEPRAVAGTARGVAIERIRSLVERW